MIYIQQASPISAISKASSFKIKGSSGSDDFEIELADKLLSTTGQYGKWKQIRQNNPSKAEKLAHLILERHEYISGETPATTEGRLRFDALTESIKAEGIHLYKSDQFKDPIFPEIQEEETVKASQKSRSSITPQASETKESNPSKTRVKSTDDTASLTTSTLSRQFANKDCFEFLAGVLEQKGINYYGRDGVASRLIDKAKEEGKDPYIYFTGEGVTGLLCENPVTIHISDPSRSSAQTVYDEIEAHLKEGAILSYSSREFGHTGIVNNVDGRWVYVNSSGVFGNKNSYRVVEEDLKSEVAGWLRRAQRSNSSLDITFGVVDRNLAAPFSKPYFMSQGRSGSDVNLLASA